MVVSTSLDTEKTNLEFDLCIICQKRERESLVCYPSIDSYGKVLDFVKEWVSYGSKQYSEAITPEPSQLTRSQTSPLNKAACFFVMVK